MSRRTRSVKTEPQPESKEPAPKITTTRRGRAPRATQQPETKETAEVTGMAVAPLADKRIRTSLKTADDYEEKELQNHILDIPDTYVGGDSSFARQSMLWVDGQLAVGTINICRAIEGIFKEPLDNIKDNVGHTIETGNDPGVATITITDTTVTMRNEGNPIPVEQITGQPGVWAPSNIFGKLLTGSSYDKTIIRTQGGRNGYGAKLTNIFSKRFRVRVGDNVNKRTFDQTWTANMTETKGPAIVDNYTGPNYVEVEFDLDFERFGYKEAKYPAEALALFQRLIVEAAFTSKIPYTITCGGATYRQEPLTLRAMTELYYGSGVQAVYLAGWPADIKVSGDIAKGTTMAAGALPDFELAVVDRSDASIEVPQFISFVNGINTFSGGVHVDAALEQVIKRMREVIMTTELGKRCGTGRGAIGITPSILKRYIGLVLNVRLPDPKFRSQIKDYLDDPTPAFGFTADQFKPVKGWRLMYSLDGELELQRHKKLAATDGGKRRTRVILDDGIDADCAGKACKHQRVLFGVEGRSAGQFAKALIAHWPGGAQAAGYLPFRGKPLNVMKASFDQFLRNKEFAKLKEMMGLREGVDYEDPKERATLRYDVFMILADADVDGMHIAALFVLFFYCRFPSLIRAGVIQMMRTPVVRVTFLNTRNRVKGLVFRRLRDYVAWAESKAAVPHRAKYCKGLGSNSVAEVKEDAKMAGVKGGQPHKVLEFNYGTAEEDKSIDDAAIHMAFSNKEVAQRKAWMEGWIEDGTLDIETVQQIPLSVFIDQMFISYPLATLSRAIPAVDGYKYGERKILATVLDCWAAKKGGPTVIKTREIKDIKVAQLAAQTSKDTHYHPGEKNLEQTIARLAWDFTGSNNMSLLQPESMLGGMAAGGADGAEPRYTYVRPSWWINYVFKPADQDLAGFTMEEGEQCEFKYALPILPMEVINGVSGVSTAYRTLIPSYHPLTVAEWIIAYLQEEPTVPALVPYFKGFGGTVALQTRGDEKRPSRVITTGRFHMEGKRVFVDELPVRLWGEQYRKFLERLITSKKLSNYGLLDALHYSKWELVKPKFKPTIRSLRLWRTMSLDSMILLDEKGQPKHYPTIEDLMVDKVAFRRAYFEKRKAKVTHQLEEAVRRLRALVDILAAIENGALPLIDEKSNKIRGKAAITTDVQRLGLSTDVYRTIRLEDVSSEDLAQARTDLAAKEEELRVHVEQPAHAAWINELRAFIEAYIAREGDDRADLDIRDNLDLPEDEEDEEGQGAEELAPPEEGEEGEEVGEEEI